MQITFSIASLCPVLIWMALVGFFLAICFAVQDGFARLRRLHQVPCSRCAYFTGSYHLKCTIHPCKALSEEAIGCLDYEPIAELQSVDRCKQNWSKKSLLSRYRSSH